MNLGYCRDFRQSFFFVPEILSDDLFRADIPDMYLTKVATAV